MRTTPMLIMASTAILPHALSATTSPYPTCTRLYCHDHVTDPDWILLAYVGNNHLSPASSGAFGDVQYSVCTCTVVMSSSDLSPKHFLDPRAVHRAVPESQASASVLELQQCCPLMSNSTSMHIHGQQR